MEAVDVEVDLEEDCYVSDVSEISKPEVENTTARSKRPFIKKV